MANNCVKITSTAGISAAGSLSANGNGGDPNYFACNVGIGTNVPNAQLHVSNSNSPTFRLSRTGTGQIWEQGIDSSGRFGLREAASEGGTQYARLEIDDAGDTCLAHNGGCVGIGECSPQYPLHICQSGAATLAIQSNGNDDEGSKLRLIEGSANWLGGYVQYDGADNNFILGVHNVNNTTLSDDNPVIIIPRDTGNVGIGHTTPPEKLTVSGGISAGGGLSATLMNSYFDGNVGIGTNVPKPTAGSRKALHIKDTTNGAEMRAEGSGSIVNIKALTDGYVGTQGADTFHIQTNNQNRISICPNGKVGISTSDPVSSLHVAGSVYISDNTTIMGNLSVHGDQTFIDTHISTTSALSVVNAGTGPALTVKQDGSQPIAHFIDFDGDDIVFDDNGRVGIGTYSPTDYNANADDLVIKRTGHAGITIASGTTQDGNLYFADGTSGSQQYRGWVRYRHADDALTFGTEGAEKIRICSDGDVGIGTDSPTADTKLDVAGSAIIRGSSNRGLSATCADSINYFAGTVGIGTTTPPQELSVKGEITTLNTAGIQVATMQRSSDHGQFILSDSGGNNKVCLRSDGNNVFTCPVDIGATTGVGGALNLGSGCKLNLGDGDNFRIYNSTNNCIESHGGDIIFYQYDHGDDIAFCAENSSGTAHEYYRIDSSAETNLFKRDVTVGEDGTGHDVIFYGDTASAYLQWDQSEDTLKTAGGAFVDIVKDKLKIGGTAVTTTAAELNLLDGLGSIPGACCEGTVTSVTKGNGIDGSGNITSTGTIAVGQGTGITVNTNDVAVAAAQTGITSILATDLKIGEDDQTKIDFETADEIHFYAANAEQVYVADGVFGPQTDSDVDLGTSSVRWKHGHFDEVTVNDDLIINTGLFCSCNTTDASSSSTGAARFLGGVGIAKKLYVGTNLDVGGTLTVDDDVAVDTDTFFVDVSEDRVGINNASPLYSLDVTGGIRFTTSSIADADITFSDCKKANFGNSTDFQIKHDGDGHNKLTSLNGDIRFYTSISNERLRIDDSTGLVTVYDDLDVDGTANLDAVDIDGNVQIDGTLTVGVDDTGYDVKFFGATAGSFMMWDESEDALCLTDSTPLKIGDDDDLCIYHNGDNSYIMNSHSGDFFIRTDHASSSLVLGHGAEKSFLSVKDGRAELRFNDNKKFETTNTGIDVTGEVKGDSLDIDGASQLDGTVTVGVDDTGYDVKFFGDTASAYMLWDASEDDLILGGAAGLTVAGNVGIGTTNPQEKLHVDEGFILADGASTNHGFELRRDSFDTFQIRHLGGNFTIRNATDARVDLSIDGDGNVDIDGTLEADAITVNGTALASVIQGTTVDNATNATTATNSVHTCVINNNATDENNEITFVENAASGSAYRGLESDADFHYNPSTGRVTATELAGTLQTAAQPNVTSLGTLTTLTVDHITINSSTISDGGTMCLDAGGDIKLDAAGNDVCLLVDGTAFGKLRKDGSDNFLIQSLGDDKDLIFCGCDNGSAIAALTLDMSEAGAATFNNKVIATELDIGSGGADIDGTLAANAITVAGATLASVIQGTTVNTAQNATNSCNLNIADNESTDENDLIPFIADAGSTGNVCLESDGDFHYNPSSGTVTATKFDGCVHQATQECITSLGTLTTLTVDDITINGSTISDTSDLTIDVGGDIILDAEDNDIIFKDAGSTFGKITNNSQNLEIHASTNDKDIVFKGFDDGAGLTALTLDMSDAGTATFNNKVCIGNSKLVLNGTAVTACAAELNLLDGCSSLPSGTVTSVAGGTGLTSTGGTTPSLSVDAAQTGITSILATDLKVGEDDQTKIDFETADEIHFYANNIEQVYLGDNIFGPQSDSDVDLGADAIRWKDAYVDKITAGDITIDSSTISDGGSMCLDAGGDIKLDAAGNDVCLLAGGTEFGTLRNDSSNLAICSKVNDKDIIFKGVDNSSDITALTLDMSDAGSATFNNDIITDGSICVNRLAGGTPYDNFKISTADIVTTLERVENTGDASAGYGRIDFKTNATTGGTAGRGGFKFIDGDGDSILYLENNDASATFADKVCIGDGKLVLNGTAVTACASELNLLDGKSSLVTCVGSGTGLTGTVTSAGELCVAAAQTGISSILATDLKIGEDDQTKIDFETADEIHFYAANAEQVYVADGIFGPQTDSDVDLGSSSVKWKSGHLDNITVGSNATLNDVSVGNLDVETGLFCVCTVTDASSSSTGAARFLGGVGIAKKLYVGTDLDVDGTTNLDAVDIDGNVQLDGTLTVGVNDTGYDVQFYGATADRFLKWDESENALCLTDNTHLKIGDGDDLQIYHDCDNSYIAQGGTGNLLITHNQNNADIRLQASAGSGTAVDYVILDSSQCAIRMKRQTKWDDNICATFGDGSDLCIYHDGSHNYVSAEGGCGSLYIRPGSGNTVQIEDKDGQDMITASGAGAVGLYHDNSKKLETFASGISVTGSVNADQVHLGDDDPLLLGSGNDFAICHNGSHSYIRDLGDGGLYLQTNGPAIYLQDTDGNAMAQFTDGGSSFLMHNGSTKLNTDASGTKVTGRLCVTGGNTSLQLNPAGSGNCTIFTGCNTSVTDSGVLRIGIPSSGGSFSNGAALGDVVIRNETTSGDLILTSSSGEVHLGAGGTDGDTQLKITDGAILPVADDSIDLGSSSYEFKDAYFDGTITADGLSVVADATITGSLVVDDMTFNGSNITDAGNFYIDVGGDINLDAAGGNICLLADGTNFADLFKSGSYDFFIKNPISDGNIKFQVNDGGSGVTALTIDGSNAGTATFNSNVCLGGSLALTSDSSQAQFGADNDMQIYHNGAGGTINVATGSLTLDVEGDISIDANGGDICLKDDGTEFGRLRNNSNNFVVESKISNQNLIFCGNDGGVQKSALTLDMSDAGTAIFSNNVCVTGMVRQAVGICSNTASYCLTLADHGKLINMNASSEVCATIPPNSSVCFPVGAEITLFQGGAGQILIQAGSGVTARSADSELRTRVQYSSVVLTQIATDEWLIAGDLTA